MHFWIAATGRMKAGPLLDLYEDYASRITWPLTLREVEVRNSSSMESRQKEEGKKLLAAIPEKCFLVALDERGQNFGSESFAKKIQGWQNANVSQVAFLVGGADGHGDDIRQKADLLWALGPMTWPHMLVRILVMEQLYRAQQILAGHPYHRNG